MRAATDAFESETDTTDHASLRLMLAYVEAECRRIGATDAARHAALAAALMAARQAGAAVPPDVRVH